MKRFLNLVVYILTIHVSALLIAGLFRLVLFISSYHQLTSEALSDKTLPMLAFVHGVWFDNVIGCYILLLPLVVAVVCGVCNYYGKALFRFFTIFFSVFYGLVYLISASDIPYFAYFFKHINSSIFEWFGYAGTTAGMILGESAYYLSIGLFLLFLAGFVVWLIYLARYFHHRSLTISAPFPYWKRGGAVLIGACLIGLCIFGIRGRTGYNPIKVSAAYFCQDAFLNQLGVSPTFNLLTSVMDDMRPENKYLHLMDEQEAITKAQALLNRPGDANVSPLAVYRHAAKADSVQQRRPNVVLIMMESMSAKFMKHFGQSETLTPFLDSLYTRSISFRNFYSAGIHTNHGLYATLYSFPAMMKRNLMKGSVIPRYSGLPTVLKENGYYNLFFMTHEGQYDNMNAFFRTNGYDEVFSQENYPADKVVNSFGVQDDIKINVGTVYKRPENLTMDVRGRNLVTGLPKTVTVTSEETEEALREPAYQIVDAVHNVLERTPPELAADISDRGIVLTGGGSLIQGLEELIEEKTGINTMTAEDPLTAVAIGTGKYIEYLAEDDKKKTKKK